MKSLLESRFVLKYVFVFVTSGIVSTLVSLAAHIVPDVSDGVFAVAVAIPFTIALLLRVFRQTYAGENLGKVLFAGLPALGLVLALLLCSTPTPVTYFHSWAITYAITAAFFLSVISGGLSRFLQLRKLLFAIFIIWVAAALIDEVARWLFEAFTIKFPNGVILGYNLFFMFNAVAIVALLSIYPIHSLPKIRSLWVLSVAGGCLLGYLFSVPIIMALLCFIKHNVLSFVLAQVIRDSLVNAGGSAFAAMGQMKWSQKG